MLKQNARRSNRLAALDATERSSTVSQAVTYSANVRVMARTLRSGESSEGGWQDVLALP
ncbi:MAG TPA: hypothetical protein VGD59_15420 [Acidisarcina sp.]